MNVRELITELLEYDLDAPVRVNLHLNDDREEKDFTTHHNVILNEVFIDLDLKDEILLDVREFDELEEDSQTLERMIQEQEAEK